MDGDEQPEPLDVTPKFREIERRQRQASPAVQPVYDCPSDRADHHASGEGGNREVEESADRRSIRRHGANQD